MYTVGVTDHTSGGTQIQLNLNDRVFFKTLNEQGIECILTIRDV